MLDPTKVLADALGGHLAEMYRRVFGGREPRYAEIIDEAARLGYESPADVAERYPTFFWSKVVPFVGDAIGYLDLTVEGRQWVANLYSHVFAIEHDRRSMGPHTGGNR